MSSTINYCPSQYSAFLADDIKQVCEKAEQIKAVKSDLYLD